MSEEPKKTLEIFHYATFEEMEEAKRQRMLARTPQERYHDLLELIGLSFWMNPLDKDAPREGLIILPQRKHLYA